MPNQEQIALTFIVDAERANQRADNFLFSKLKKVPKTAIYKMLRKGRIRINKKRVKPDYRLQTGDVIRLPNFLQQDIEKIPTKLNIKKIPKLEQNILYEDENLIVLNKPSGLAVHGGSGINFGIIESMRAARPKSKNLELAHRLDRDTSGCLILAKKRGILREVHELLRQGKVEKYYLVLVRGKWDGGARKVTAGLMKNKLQSGERMVKVSAEGKSALTTFTPQKIFKDTSLLMVKLGTGRTHQIRVHAAHIGHPIAGDEKYGDKEFNAKMRKHGLKRLFLHAVKIKLKLQSLAKVLRIEAPLPEDLEELLELLP